ncbi:hypothetical protein FQR65_LT09078 [Abscondita terminalis]|nr:hypothetical protein FQR65_LT09078 [Abscondita terminalis]
MRTLFCIFLFGLLLHQYDSKPTGDDMKLAEKTCLTELHLQSSDLPDLGNFKKEDVDTPNNRKMFACLFTKMGILDEEQKINSDGFDNFVQVLVNATREGKNEASIRESLSQCKDIEGRSGGEIGIQLRNCFRRAGLEMRRKHITSDNS